MTVTVSPTTGLVPAPPLRIYNGTGSTLQPGQQASLRGYNVANGVPSVILADNTVAGARAMAVVTDAILNGAVGTVYPEDQLVTGVNVGAASVQDAVFLGTAGGYAFTTAPTGGARVERIGTVVSAGASGSILLWPAALQAVS